MRWLRSEYHALSSLRAPQPCSPSAYKDTTTRIPSMSSIRALSRNCSLATLKHNYVHYDTCQPRCANTCALPRMSSTRSHAPQLPFLLLSTLTLPSGSHAPRAGITTPVPGKNMNCLDSSNIPRFIATCFQASPLSSPLLSAYTALMGPLPGHFIVWTRRRYPTRRN
jgi:hypothetical protein